VRAERLNWLPLPAAEASSAETIPAGKAACRTLPGVRLFEQKAAVPPLSEINTFARSSRSHRRSPQLLM
jgi:hypothetical protein